MDKYSEKLANKKDLAAIALGYSSAGSMATALGNAYRDGTLPDAIASMLARLAETDSHADSIVKAIVPISVAADEEPRVSRFIRADDVDFRTIHRHPAP